MQGGWGGVRSGLACGPVCARADIPEPSNPAVGLVFNLISTHYVSMSDESRRADIRQVGQTAWRTTVLVAATLLILTMFVGMGFLVYRGRMSDGPLILFSGVILGYILRSAHKLI